MTDLKHKIITSIDDTTGYSRIIKNIDNMSMYDRICLGLVKGLFGIIIGAELALLTYVITLPKPEEKESCTLETSLYSKRYSQDHSLIQLLDLDKDGFYDWKTVYTRENGELKSIDVIAKESYFEKYGLFERRQYIKIVSDTTKLE